MKYTGFPIYDFKTGLFNEREPWISPADAFEDFNNCNLDRGIIQKRKGHTYFSRLNYKVATITAITQANPASITTSAAHGLSTGDVVTLNGITGMTELNGITARVFVVSSTVFHCSGRNSSAFTAYVSGGIVYKAPNIAGCMISSSISKSNPAIVTTIGTHSFSDGDIVTIPSVYFDDTTTGLPLNGGMETLKNTYSRVSILSTTTFQLDDIDTTGMSGSGLGVVSGIITPGQLTGIAEYEIPGGQGELLVTDEKRVGAYNTTTKEIYDIALSDIFTGNANDTFVFQNWLSKIYFVNGVDRVQSWDGTTLSSITIDIDGNASNDVDTCKDIKLLGNRLLLFSTTEASVEYAQRIRWSALLDPTLWDDTITAGGGFLDISTSDEFISATYLKDKIVLNFSRSTWVLGQTGNIDLPFRAEKIDSFHSNNALHGSAVVSDKMFSLGSTGISLTNGFRVDGFDKTIPEFPDEIEGSRASQIFSQVFERDKELWLAFPSLDETMNDKVLIYNYAENNFSMNDVRTSVFGLFKTSFSKTWDNEERSWNAISERWDDFSSGGGHPLVFFGDEYGNILRLSDGFLDNGKVVEMNLKTSRFNPFREAGGGSVSAQLGEVHFLLSSDDQSTLTVDLYINFDETPYKTVVFDLDPVNNTTNKVLKIIHSGAIGQFHRIGIRNEEATSSVKIHLIKPFLRAAGEMKQIV